MPAGPSPRAVDWAILVVLASQAATGVGTLFAGVPDGGWIIVLHGVGGLVLAGLVAMKLWRVRHRLRPGTVRREMASSVVAAVIVVTVLATGIAWSSGWRPWVGLWTLLSIHTGLAILLVVPVLVHLRRRLHRPRAIDFTERRTAMQFALLAGVGTVAWNLQRWLAGLLAAPGRFTGSYETGSLAGNGFPTTSWVADAPDPIDAGDWTLVVDGAVTDSLQLAAADLEVGAEREAVLDCTSGWYSNQRWRGVAVGSLLDRAGAREAATWVAFHSVTGYRWSLPIEEARGALLATHVGGERLSHGHGFPLRLVAPGRRGFQWVKWVERVEVRTAPDYGQWVAIFTSGFD